MSTPECDVITQRTHVSYPLYTVPHNNNNININCNNDLQKLRLM